MKIKKLIIGFLAVSLLAISGCSKVEDIINDTEGKEQEQATKVAENFVRDYFTYEGNENSELLDVSKIWRDGIVKKRPVFTIETPNMELFEEKTIVDEIKIEDIQKSVVCLSQFKDYSNGTTAKRYKGDLKVYDLNYLTEGTFYGYEIEQVIDKKNAILKDVGEFNYGDALYVDIKDDEKGWYRAYDVTLRWSYTNRDMMTDGTTEDDDCIINRIVVRLLYVDSQWKVNSFFFPQDSKICTTII